MDAEQSASPHAQCAVAVGSRVMPSLDCGWGGCAPVTATVCGLHG